MDSFDDPFWTLEQVLSWRITYDRELVASNSAQALTEHVQQYQDGPKTLGTSRTPLKKFLHNNRQLWDSLREAKQELLRALQRGDLVASGISRESKDRVLIDRIHWIDHGIGEGRDGVLGNGWISGNNSVTRSTPYKEIRVEQAAVMDLWPEPKQSVPDLRSEQKQGIFTTAGAQTRAFQYFYNLMQASIHAPTTTKRDAINAAMAQDDKLSVRAAGRAWDEAISKTGATAWARPGRRPKKIAAP